MRENIFVATLLSENHCPICSLAESCQQFCNRELELFEEIFGTGAKIKREEHIIAGNRRCTYRIRKRK